MRKKLLIFLPLLVLPFLLASCTRVKDNTITNVITVVGEEQEVMQIKNTITDVYEEASKSCVGIYATKEQSASTGSGVIYKKEGSYYYVVTNHHVIDEKTSYKIYDGDKHYYKATLIGSDKTNDIAVLRFNTDVYGEFREYKPLDLFAEGLTDIPTVGQTVIAIGCPLDISHYNSVTAGIISRYTLEQITTDAAVNPGNSGGGLFNIKGKLIGIINSGQVWTATTSGNIPVEGEGYAISAYLVKKCIKDIEQRNTVITRPVLGVVVATINTLISENSELLQYLPLGTPDIVYNVVQEVKAGSTAEEYGIKAHDVLLEINGNKIVNNTDIGEVLHVANPGETITLKIYRSSSKETINLDVVLK